MYLETKDWSVLKVSNPYLLWLYFNVHTYIKVIRVFFSKICKYYIRHHYIFFNQITFTLLKSQKAQRNIYTFLCMYAPRSLLIFFNVILFLQSKYFSQYIFYFRMYIPIHTYICIVCISFIFWRLSDASLLRLVQRLITFRFVLKRISSALSWWTKLWNL